MSVVFLLSLLTFNIYLWIKQENALVTPRIRVSTRGESSIITTACDALWYFCIQTDRASPLPPKRADFYPAEDEIRLVLVNK